MNFRILALCATCLLGACGPPPGHRHFAPDTVVKGSLDDPRNNAQINGPFVIRGWALSEDGIEWVAIYIDSVFLTYAKTGLFRPDVGKVYILIPGSSDSGWQFDATPGLFMEGPHQLTIEACSKKGEIVTIGIARIEIRH